MQKIIFIIEKLKNTKSAQLLSQVSHVRSALGQVALTAGQCSVDLRKSSCQ